MSNDHPHDTLFKKAMSRPELAASELRVALGPALSARIDWSTLALLPGDAGGQAPGHSRAPDLLFIAQRVDETRDDVLVYLLFEHQSSQHPLMPLRLLTYMVDAWARWEKHTRKRGGKRPPLPPILPVVLSHAPGGWRGPARLVELCRFSDADRGLFAPFVPDFRYFVDDLAKASQLELLADRDLEPAARLVLWILRDARDGDGFVQHAERLFALLEAVVDRGHALDLDLVDDAFLYLRIVLPESAAADLTALARAAAPAYPRGAHVAMNSLQKLYEQGRQEGRQEGMAAGLCATLQSRFGALSEAHRRRIDSMDAPALDEAFKRVFTADSIEAVIG